MRVNLFVLLLLLTASRVKAQTDSFDVFVYKVPEFFTKSLLPSRAQFALANPDKNYCIISLYPAQPAGDSAIRDLQRQWNEYVVKRYRKASPKPLQVYTEQLWKGWVSTVAIGNFFEGKKKCVVMLNSFRKDRSTACVVYAMTDKLFKGPTEYFSKHLEFKN